MATEAVSAAELFPASSSVRVTRDRGQLIDSSLAPVAALRLTDGEPLSGSGPISRGNRLLTDERTGSAVGIFDKITGRAKQAAGDLTDDASMRRQGKREERKGEKKEELDRAQDKADEKAEEVADLERKT